MKRFLFLSSNPQAVFNYFAIIVAVILFVVSVYGNFSFKGEQQFVYMASSFLQGKLYLTEMPGTWMDSAYFEGNYYWPLGPLPAIILLPFVLVAEKAGFFFNQGYLQMILSMFVFYLCYRIAIRYKYSNLDSLFLATAFCFASVYHLVMYIPWSWYFAHAVVVLLVLASLYEYFTKKRLFIIGIIYGLVLMGRYTASLGLLFFIADILFFHKISGKKKIVSLLKLVTPVILSLFILLGYNYLRFSGVTETGYSFVDINNLSEKDRFERINYGFFQLRNIPTGFYYYFLNGLKPVLVDAQSLYGNTYILKPPYLTVAFPGTGFFIVSPIFLYIFTADLRKKIIRLSLFPSLVILIVLLAYFWPGWRQTGPRYLMDLLPFLYIILLNSFKNYKIGNFSKTLIIASALFNLYLTTTIFE